jgi:hypothetical protein
MCVFSAPKVPAQPQPAQMQATQLPKDLVQGKDNRRALMRRRGMWSSIFTSPQGVSGAPMTTGGSASMTGA